MKKDVHPEYHMIDVKMTDGTIVKMNQKTVEIQDAGATPFGRTVTRVPASMIIGKVAA